MPNSLRSRLKNLVHKGVLSQKDLDRIVIVPVDGNGDLISRQAAIDCLTATKLKKFDFILQAREEIKNLPSVSTEKTGRWIPVSERLPEGLMVKTLVSCEDDNGLPISTMVALYDAFSKTWDCKYKVIAWTQLPEPYDPYDDEGERV